jgi:V8-like Glu-specific endopeptidase
MVTLKTVSKPVPGPFEALEAASPPPQRIVTPGAVGSADPGASRALKHIVVKGKSGPITSPFESVIGRDDRVRILDTDLAPWRMICALRMRRPDGREVYGTGWFIGPKTVVTAGHCVFSNQFFGGWASSIEVIPGMNGSGIDARPYGSLTSTRFSSVDRWTASEDPDFDIGCIHLDQPKGSEVGWFALAALPASELESYLINVSGYPLDRGEGAEQWHNRNRVLGVTERRLFYEVDTKGGQSGAPVWIHETDGAPPLAVAIHAYGIGATPSNLGLTANSAPRIIPEVLERLTEWVEQDGGWPQT